MVSTIILNRISIPRTRACTEILLPLARISFPWLWPYPRPLRTRITRTDHIYQNILLIYIQGIPSAAPYVILPKLLAHKISRNRRTYNKSHKVVFPFPKANTEQDETISFWQFTIISLIFLPFYGFFFLSTPMKPSTHITRTLHTFSET